MTGGPRIEVGVEFTPVQQAKIDTIRGAVDAYERAMADEGVPADVRHRVAMRVLYGGPESPFDEMLRIHQSGRPFVKITGIELPEPIPPPGTPEYTRFLTDVIGPAYRQAQEQGGTTP